MSDEHQDFEIPKTGWKPVEKLEKLPCVVIKHQTMGMLAGKAHSQGARNMFATAGLFEKGTNVFTLGSDAMRLLTFAEQERDGKNELVRVPMNECDEQATRKGS